MDTFLLCIKNIELLSVQFLNIGIMNIQKIFFISFKFIVSHFHFLVLFDGFNVFMPLVNSMQFRCDMCLLLEHCLLSLT